MSDVQHTPQRPGRLARLADVAFRRRRLVVLGWIVALAATFAASGALAGQFSADYATPGSESQRAGDLLAKRFPARSSDTVDVVWQAADGVNRAAVQRRTGARASAPPRRPRSRATGRSRSRGSRSRSDPTACQ